PYFASVTSAENTRDSIRMAEIVHGGRAAIERAPVLAGIVNVNSPLRYDERMLGALIELARAGQAAIVTPFILMGAMAPVSIPAALAGRGRRPHLEPDRRCPGGAGVDEHDAAGVHGRSQPRHARGRLAGVGPRDVLREVGARPRGGANPGEGVCAARGRRGVH